MAGFVKLVSNRSVTAGRSSNFSADAPPLRVGLGVHLPALDGMRGLAVLLVMIFHQLVMQPMSALDRAVASVAHAGWCGVDLFFVLSGFLITGILLDSREQAHYFRNFYARRTVRIFPLYYAVVFLCFIALPHAGQIFDSPLVTEKLKRFAATDDYQWWYWAYLSNFAMAITGSFQHGVLGVTWSLAIEEQFYLVWPAVVYFCSRPALKRVCVGLILLSVALRFVLVFTRETHPMVPYVLTPTRLDGLAVGALLAIAAREGAGLPALRPAAKAALAAGFLAFISVIVIDASLGWNEFSRFGYEATEHGLGKLMQVIGYLALPIAFGGLLVLSVTAAPGTALARVFCSGIMRTLGKYSYALYLFHLPLRAVIRDTLFGPGVSGGGGGPLVKFPIIAGSQLPAQIVFWIVSSLVTLAVAWLSWNLYEKHFLKLKKYFEYRTPKDPDAEPARGMATEVVVSGRTPALSAGQ